MPRPIRATNKRTTRKFIKVNWFENLKIYLNIKPSLGFISGSSPRHKMDIRKEKPKHGCLETWRYKSETRWSSFNGIFPGSMGQSSKWPCWSPLYILLFTNQKIPLRVEVRTLGWIKRLTRSWCSNLALRTIQIR